MRFVGRCGTLHNKLGAEALLVCQPVAAHWRCTGLLNPITKIISMINRPTFQPKILKPVVAGGLIAASVFVSAQAQTLSFRCKNDLSNVGDSKASVHQKCGEPVFKDSFCKPVERPVAAKDAQGNPIVAPAVCETVDNWTYNPGVGQFMTTLRFESGKLVSITYGDRVK